jgi:beta-galactosidase
MLYGAAYYHEYQPYDRLDEDIRLMKVAGLTVVRLGESTWTSWESEDGCFEFAWMDRVIDAMHAAGIKVIFGTPTYAIPAWLHRKHPDLMAEYSQGKRAYYGARQNMNHAHPAYRFYAERVIRELIRHYAPHPAIIGYQVDNETGSGLLHNHDVFQSFVDYLKRKFGSVEKLNEVWGLTYWSHRLGDWADLWTPDGNTNPGYDLEWRRFQSWLVTDFLSWQAKLVREYARPDQFVTQDVVGAHGRGESDVYDIAQAMDVLAINPYHVTQEGLNLALGDQRVYGAPEWMIDGQLTNPGVWSIYFNGDYARGFKQNNFLITELNAGSIGSSHCNYPSYDGQWRSVVYAFIARGANMIAYWHWHTLHYGIETYWGGILNHDLEPGRTYAEFSRIAHELLDHDALLTDLKPDEDVAFLYSQDSKYALEFQPSLAQPVTFRADHGAYRKTFDTFYHAFFEARAQSVVLHPQQDFEAYPLVVVPSLYIADDMLLQRLLRYAENGGHLLLTFKSGYADEHAQIHHVRAPGVLREGIGASYQEFSNLVSDLSLENLDESFALPNDARATGWADGLLLEGATPLAYYQHPHFGRFPAIVSNAYGKGRITYCGTLPNPALAKTLADWVLQQAGIEPLFTELPTPVRLASATATSGEKLYFFSNWSWDKQTLTNLPSGYELFSGNEIDGETSLELEAWDTRIVVAR